MNTFTIYPKGKADPFTLSCERIQNDGNRFVLYNYRDEESTEGFLSFPDIAAIIPEQRTAWPYPDTPIRFLVYLKDRPTPIEVSAHAFKMEKSGLVFMIQRRDIMGKIISETPWLTLYVATSELIAVLPSDGLIYRD
jgi:hypothetical protein